MQNANALQFFRKNVYSKTLLQKRGCFHLIFAVQQIFLPVKSHKKFSFIYNEFFFFSGMNVEMFNRRLWSVENCKGVEEIKNK